MDEQKIKFDKIALSCISYLESLEECQICDFHFNDGLLSHEIVMWEKKNFPVKLPTDLRKFYSMFNGVYLGWNVDIQVY